MTTHQCRRVRSFSSAALPGARLRTLAAALAMGMAVPLAGHAATATANLNVTATVQATCSISATPVAFGTYTSTQVDVNGGLAITCSNLSGYTIGLDAGGGTGATVAARVLTNASASTQLLTYGLYRNAARTQVWGTTTGTDTVAGTGTGSVQNIPVYGRLNAGQLPEAGAYTDVVVATITY